MSGPGIASSDFRKRVQDASAAPGQAMLSRDKRFALFTLSGDQSSNLTAPNHVQFDTLQTSSGSGISQSAGTAQQLGLLTIPIGGRWKITAGFTFTAQAPTDQLCAAVFNNTDTQQEGVGGMKKTYTNGQNDNDSPQAVAFLDTVAEAKEIELRILSGAGLLTIKAGSTSFGPTWLAVEEM